MLAAFIVQIQTGPMRLASQFRDFVGIGVAAMRTERAIRPALRLARVKELVQGQYLQVRRRSAGRINPPSVANFTQVPPIRRLFARLKIERSSPAIVSEQT